MPKLENVSVLLQKEHIKTEGVRFLSFVLIRSHAHDLSIRVGSESGSDLEKFFFDYFKSSLQVKFKSKCSLQKNSLFTLSK